MSFGYFRYLLHSTIKTMKFFSIACCLLVFSICSSAQKVKSISLIPEPVSMKTEDGTFRLSSATAIIAEGTNEEVLRLANILAARFSTVTGHKYTVSKGPKSAGFIRLRLDNVKDIGDEGYELRSDAKGITISANKPAGLFYGIQTLFQLFPKEIESKTRVDQTDWLVPAVTITDYPRFQWRGLMFDVSRHFFTRQEVMDFIDEMVKYKYNLLHMHLTDDQGWRIEIKSLPQLTNVGAWRVKHEGKWGNDTAPSPNEPKTYGGYYTQDDIRQLVKYASDRFVNILPEVDVPGHSMAAVASYPELSCTPGHYQVNSGEEFMVWGGKKLQEKIDNTLCPANEKVYEFLDKVFTEMAQLFPFPYIHMGGDECAKNFWEQSDAVKALMQKEGLKNMEEVQSYFVKRVEKIIESKGKKLIGWDEIIEGGLAPDATVMSWRGMSGGIEAAKANHHVVMSPTTFVYLDYMQGDAVTEPPVYATLRLDKTYRFEPVPDSIDKQLIIGGQGNLWTEQLPNMRAVEYMLWPRSFAISEVLWSPKEKKDWPDFVRRVEDQFKRLDEAQIKYAATIYDAVFTPSMVNGQLQLNLSTEVPGLDIYYSFDETNPDQYYPKYKGEPIIVPDDAVHVKVVTYRNGRQIGKQINMPVDELKRRVRHRDE